MLCNGTEKENLRSGIEMLGKKRKKNPPQKSSYLVNIDSRFSEALAAEFPRASREDQV